MSERQTIWVCLACGKTSTDRLKFNDVACYLNSKLCYVDKLVFWGDLVINITEDALVETTQSKSK